MTIDKIDYHINSIKNFSSEEERLELAGVHIGYFIEWAYKKGFAPIAEDENDLNSYNRLINSEINGIEFLINNCDTKFWDEDLNEDGLKFTNYAYDNYLESFVTITERKPYSRKYNKEEFIKISNYLDSVYVKYNNK